MVSLYLSHLFCMLQLAHSVAVTWVHQNLNVKVIIISMRVTTTEHDWARELLWNNMKKTMRGDQHTHQALQNPRVGTSVLQLRTSLWWQSDHYVSQFTELPLVSAEVADNLQCTLPSSLLQSSFFQTMRTHSRDYLPREKLFQLLQTLTRNSKTVYQVHFYEDVKYVRSIPSINYYTKKSLAFRFCGGGVGDGGTQHTPPAKSKRNTSSNTNYYYLQQPKWKFCRKWKLAHFSVKLNFLLIENQDYAGK